MARIALDIDSTLHHYWDQLAAAAKRRFGVTMPYDEQVTWGISLLKPEQIKACVAETHREENILAAEPYPGAVEVVAAWHGAGHWIHVTSHRHTYAADATTRWLERIGMPFDDLHCSFDKVTRCVELGIDVLVDDSPVNLVKAKEAGIAGATLIHPWNEELVERGDAIGAPTWQELRVKLDPVLS